MTADDSADLAEQPLAQVAPEAEIATLPPNTTNASAVAVNPRTGEPRRSWLVWLTGASCLLAATAAVAALLGSYWVAVTDFAHASWLTAQVAEPSVLTQVLLVVGLTAAALLVAISNVITGYYAWFGYRWTRIAGAISGVLSLLSLLLNPIGWFAIGFSLAGTGLLWLPPFSAFFAAWQTHRHPQAEFAPPTTSVTYGPLPRYRRS
jgi:hypothetical protein